MVTERFLKYVSFDTRSEDGIDAVPSTEKQFALARELEAEMKAMGLSDVTLAEHCYVYGYIPENAPGLPTLGFIAHMDTSPEVSGKDIKPRIIKGYEGGDIRLSDSVSIEESMFPFMERFVGDDLIVTDGTTLLGADDKAGVAEIMTMAENLLKHPEITHGRIAIAFTPDEEVGNGPEFFDVAGFGADFAYTVDGGMLGELEYENFNACTARVTVNGLSIHPGSAKGKMKNAIHIAFEFDSMLPAAERPEYTDGYEGFYHLGHVEGATDRLMMGYIIRDHDRASFEKRKQLMESAAALINERYGENTLALELTDSYYNMKEKILPHMELIDRARKAMENVGVTPSVSPIRGGTDGARLSFMGLPCPNLCTGGCNFHGEREFISINAMEKITEMLLELVRLTYAD